ncbi:MAG: glycosyltransferase family 2 protein [Oligoflexia bacterium]|nr:glycosyltransferase family 2 protein [Oligoflexia bacterium]
MKISAFVICKNEEKVLEGCLKSLSFSDELVIVDGFSQDRTVEIAKKYTSQVFQREWTNFSEQRNFALEKLTGDWVFYLDADEVASPELVDWIRQFKSRGETALVNHTAQSLSRHPMDNPKTERIDMIEIRRLEHFRGVIYRFGANNPSHQWRLFRRPGVRFKGEVHEYPVFEGIIRRLETPILHFPKTTISDLMEKMNRYTSLDADRLFQERKIKGPAYMFFSGFAMFFKAYFRKQGFRDGLLGFILAVLDGTSFFLRQAKLYLKNKESGRV